MPVSTRSKKPAELKEPKEPKKPRLSRPASSEHKEQAAVMEWCRLHSGLWPELDFAFAIPNGAKLPFRKNRDGSRYSLEAIKLKQEGLLPGVSDIFIPAARGGFNGMFLEMKYGKNTVSDVQQVFIDAMKKYGYYAVPAWGYEQAVEIIKDYMLGKIIALSDNG